MRFMTQLLPLALCATLSTALSTGNEPRDAAPPGPAPSGSIDGNYVILNYHFDGTGLYTAWPYTKGGAHCVNLPERSEADEFSGGYHLYGSVKCKFFAASNCEIGTKSHTPLWINMGLFGNTQFHPRSFACKLPLAGDTIFPPV